MLTPLAAPIVFSLMAFAANSLLCRMALRRSEIDPASFTAVRILSGALVLSILFFLRTRRASPRPAPRAGFGGNWLSGALLLAYAAAFSFAYVVVTTGTGALLLFGAVQVIMIAAGFRAGERIDLQIVAGWMLAVAGVALLVLPGVSAAPLAGAASMLCAGIAWGFYSLRGRGSRDPLGDTAGNFARAVPGALFISALLWHRRSLSREGIMLAVASGAIASGLGYAAWYTALPRIRAIAAANLQLCVPVIAGIGGVLLFGEPITLRLTASTILVLGGVSLAIQVKARAAAVAK